MADRTPTEREPRTPTGRALLDAPDVLLMMSDGEIIGLNEGELELQIVAIEREAAGAATETGGLDEHGVNVIRSAIALLPPGHIATELRAILARLSVHPDREGAE